jgi:hypothetical protein
VPLLTALPLWREFYMEERSAGSGPFGKADAMLPLANAILAMCRSPKCRLADTFGGAIFDDREWAGRPGGPLKLPIPDYALDQHTAKGKQLGRGVDFWMDVGCKLVPEPDRADPVYGDLNDERYRERARESWKNHGIYGAKWLKRKAITAAKKSPTEPATDQGDCLGHEPVDAL